MKPLTELAFVCPISTSRAIHVFVISTSVLVTWFLQRAVVTLQRAQARAIHARTARLEASSSPLSTLPFSRVSQLGISWRMRVSYRNRSCAYIMSIADKQAKVLKLMYTLGSSCAHPAQPQYSKYSLQAHSWDTEKVCP